MPKRTTVVQNVPNSGMVTQGNGNEIEIVDLTELPDSPPPRRKRMEFNDETIQILTPTPPPPPLRPLSPVNRFECPICYLSFDDIKRDSNRELISTKCGHVFCSRCLQDALNVCKLCPMCRKKVMPKQNITLHL
ncbi:E3 ubiquitin-protein ligase RNF4 [Halotydeus destructor]|nr:E3 ubiquitin-protein ligase RNF4 [Halotydeus destructor]